MNRIRRPILVLSVLVAIASSTGIAPGDDKTASRRTDVHLFGGDISPDAPLASWYHQLGITDVWLYPFKGAFPQDQRTDTQKTVEDLERDRVLAAYQHQAIRYWWFERPVPDCAYETQKRPDRPGLHLWDWWYQGFKDAGLDLFLGAEHTRAFAQEKPQRAEQSSDLKKLCPAAVGSLTGALAGAGMDSAARNRAEVNERLNKLIGDIVAPLGTIGVSLDSNGHLVTRPTPQGSARSVTDYARHVTTGTWTETGPAGTSSVTAELWTGAIQTALDENQTVFIPYRGEPYYIDAPLVLRSGNRLIVAPNAEIRLKPGTNTCMARNERQAGGQEGPVRHDNDLDTDLMVEGGIWTTLAVSSAANGNLQGGPDRANTLHGHGTILLNHVKRVQVRNVTIKECRPHGIQLSDVSEFLVENIRFNDHRRDGVHVNGPASYGVIRDIRGVTGDDMVALNGWDWKNTSMTFGPISHILVEKVHAGAPGSDFRADIRLLGGTKHFPNGKTLACDIENCVVRDISGVRAFKMYDQPNLEMGRDNDFADPIGNLRNLGFSRIEIDDPTEPTFQIASNADGLTIANVLLSFDKPADKFKLVRIGPLSMTYKFDPNNPASWVEVFSPDKDCTVRHLQISNLRQRQNACGKAVEMELQASDYIEVATQKPNPDYPKTTPKGGTGRGILIP